MGYSTDITASHEPLTMVQTPENVRAVRLRAGWNIAECAKNCAIHPIDLSRAEDGILPLDDMEWQRMLRICGQRVFDRE